MTIMFTHQYIEPHQVNAFVYCKRKWYYQNRLKLQIINDHMEIGSYIKEHHWMKTIKRKEIYLMSNKWKLKGMCDYIIEENGFQIPIEIKKGKCSAVKPYKNDVMQLLCYVLLLKENLGIKYTHGYILYVGSKRKFTVNITPNLRKRIQNYFKEIKSYLRSEKMPERQSNKICCGVCSFEEYCWFE